MNFTPQLIVKDDCTVISDAKKLEKAKVTAEIMGEHRGDKVDVFKYKNKTGYRRSAGHRQTYTTIKVKKITLTSRKKTDSKAAADEKVAATKEK